MLSSRHVEKLLVLRTSAPKTPAGREQKRAAAVKARVPMDGRMVVCVCRREALSGQADQTPKLLTSSRPDGGVVESRQR